MEKALLNLYRIKLNYDKLNLYEIQLDTNLLKESEKFSIVNKISFRLYGLNKFFISAYLNYIACKQFDKLDIRQVENVLKEELKYAGLDINFKVNYKEIKFESDPRLFQQFVERFLILEINDFLRKSGFQTFRRSRYISVRLTELVDKSLLIMNNYKAERFVNLRIITNQNNQKEPFLQIDSTSSIEGTTTIWEQLNQYISKNKISIEQLKENTELQEELNLEFKSNNPRLTTTYSRKLAMGGEKKDLYFFVNFDFNNNPYTRKIVIDNKEISVSEYYKSKYNIAFEEKEQFIVNVRRASLGGSRRDTIQAIPIPSNLIIETPDTKSLERYDFSYEYSKFTLLSPEDRKKLIDVISSILIANNFISADLEVDIFRTKLPELFDGKRKFSFYDERDYSGQYLEFPDIKRIKILVFSKTESWFNRNNGGTIINSLKNEIFSHLNFVSTDSSNKIENINYEIFFEIQKNWKNTIDRLMHNNKFDAYIIVTSPPSQTFYNYVKRTFSIKKGIPTQFILFSTLQKLYKKKHMKGLAKSLVKQIVVKCGGIPYLLVNNNIKETIYIGVDRSRDVFSDKPSLSAGVAAVAPNGEYLGADSTYLDKYTDDFIDIAEILPRIISKIKTQCPKAKKLVVLHDGGKYNITDYELNTAEKITEEENLDLIFLSANKSSGFRAFKHMNNKFEGFSQPVLIKDLPNDQEDFLIFTTLPRHGTQTPILYSILKNTTEFSYSEIKVELADDLAGLCSLVWEAMGPTNLPLPLHYADKLAGFCKNIETPWDSEIEAPLFI